MPVRTLLASALTALLAATPGTARAQASGSVEDAVRRAEAARREALLAADTVALSRLVGAEFIEISRFGTIRTRDVNLGEIATGDLRLLAIQYDSLSVQSYGDVAVLRGIATNTGTYLGRSFGGRIRYTRVFVRRDSRWQAVAMQQTAMP